MNITVKDFVGLSAEDNLKLLRSLLDNRKPKEGSFDYGFETHGVFELISNLHLDYPIQVYQSNKRKSDKSPIVVTIEKHKMLF
jgi:hypothetical protein